MKNLFLSFVFVMMATCSSYMNCYEIKTSLKKSQETFACSKHGNGCKGNHGHVSKNK